MEPVSNTQTELIGYLSVLSVPTLPTDGYLMGVGRVIVS